MPPKFIRDKLNELPERTYVQIIPNNDGTFTLKFSNGMEITLLENFEYNVYIECDCY